MKYMFKRYIVMDRWLIETTFNTGSWIWNRQKSSIFQH